MISILCFLRPLCTIVVSGFICIFYLFPNRFTLRWVLEGSDMVNIQADFTINAMHHCPHFHSLLNNAIYSCKQSYNTSNQNCDRSVSWNICWGLLGLVLCRGLSIPLAFIYAFRHKWRNYLQTSGYNPWLSSCLTVYVPRGKLWMVIALHQCRHYLHGQNYPGKARIMNALLTY